MLPNIDSKYQTELGMINEFSLGLKTTKGVIKNNLSNALKLSKIAINLSPLLKDSLFCPRNKNDSNQITVQDLLKLFVARWSQEALYQQEILTIKDQIIDEFEKLCNNAKDENLIKVIRKERELIVEALFAKTNFDQKQLAGDFCKSFMNGFEIEMIEKIEYYATYVVWMPFTTPLPEGLVEFTKKIIDEEISKPSDEANIASASAKIKNYIEDELKEREIQIQKEALESSILFNEKNVIAINQLQEILNKAKNSRKACALIINKVDHDDIIISNERANVQTIFVKMKASQFLKVNLPFTYEYLELKDLENEKKFKQALQILQRLPKCLKGAILEFKYQPKKKGTDEEIITLSKVFTHSKTIHHLHLNFMEASITIDTINKLATSIHKINTMTFLDLNFMCGKNSANNYSMALFAEAISEMTNLCHLGCYFGWGNNEITDDGIIQISQAIIKCINIQELILFFENPFCGGGKNVVTDKGIEVLSKSIANLKNIQQLDLSYAWGDHQISDKGMQALAVALKNTNNISDLRFSFDKGKNSITDASMDSLADALKQMSPELSINFYFRSNNSPRVTANGESIIKNARVYKSIVFRHGSDLL